MLYILTTSLEREQKCLIVTGRWFSVCFKAVLYILLLAHGLIVYPLDDLSFMLTFV